MCNMGPLIFSRKAPPLQVSARGWTPAVRLHNPLNMTLQPEQTHNLFIRQTHPLFPASACRSPLQLGRLWQSCFGMQYVWVSRGVGCGGGTWLEVGQSFLEDVRRAQPRSYSAGSALHRSITVYTCSAKPCWGQSHTWGGVHACRHGLNAPGSIIVRGGSWEWQQSIKDMGE